ncbi:hypothetical protein HJD18_06115 [Thermoleophilia bacterium SCSIO 60948]|nr:hypothetical protein HJD18_06115 [Thermoleophilia bacterium SCSIO 60948]
MPEAGTIDVHWHPACLRHETGEGVFEAPASDLIAIPEKHPENDERIANVKSILERGPLGDRVRWRGGREATLDELLRVHTAEHVERVSALRGTRTMIDFGDGQTRGGPHSWRAALAAAGTAISAADAVLAGDERLAYSLTRPPGHHAAPGRIDGYCLFNNSALAAQRAIDAGRRRVAIVDWDVHHGNGTQACFYERADVLTISIHQDHRSWGPSHPEDGLASELGAGEGEGYNVNVALPFGAGERAYGESFERVVAPALDRFDPDFLIGACGQDASQFDPNGRQCLTMNGFRAIGASMAAFAARHTDGRLLLCQEGGYARTYAAFCQLATLAGALGVDPGLADPLGPPYGEAGAHGEAIEAAERVVARIGASV